MKRFKSVLALLLALVMILSCVGSAAALEPTGKAKVSELAKARKSDSISKNRSEMLKGFKSEKFNTLNTYKYADDEIVRAIVVLESAPEADVAENNSERAASYRIKLNNEHNAVRRAMSSIDYELQYDFTSLLNGFSCDVAYGDLDKIAAIDGVEAVYIANRYAAPVDETPSMENAGQMTGNAYAKSLYGAAGQGTVIAVMDTGFRLSHEAFQVYDEEYMNENAKLTAEDIDLAVADGVYVSAKVPFAYDYADKDNDVTDYDGHGTHVAGIAAGYVETEDGEVTFSGAAPAAQILAMKVFNDKNVGTSSDIYFYALEDAYRLGADVINMSLGSQNGFTYDDELETEVFGNIYQRLSKAGVVLCIAAGNEYSMAEYSYNGYIGPEYTDYGTVGTPSTYEGTVSIASVENTRYPQHILKLGEEIIGYTDSSDDGLWLSTFGGEDPVDYVIVTDAEGNISLGVPEDFTSAVEGKIAVVKRGIISFEAKVENAANAGAVGCIVVNSADESFGMAIETFEIPAISVTLSALDILQAADPKQVSTPNEMATLENPKAWQMSDFSSWGTTPDLTMKPTITSVGGNVYSSVNSGDASYDVYSGTSMAAPNMAGTFANVLSYLAEQGYSKTEAAETAKALLESTAERLEDENGYLYSVRRQGAGLGVSVYALEAFEDFGYITNPIQELGDDPERNGSYTFDVELVNSGEDEVVYTPDTIALCDYIDVDADSGIEYNTLTSDYAGVNVTYTVGGSAVETITLGAGERATVTVSIALTEDMKVYINNTFENGTFVEGYVVFYANLDGYYYDSEAHATFLGYYGDWTDGAVLEEADFRDYAEADYFVHTYDLGDGATPADLDMTAEDLLDFYTSPNMAYMLNLYTGRGSLLGDNMLDYVPYNEAHCAFSTEKSNGTGYYYDFLYMEPYQLRNATHLIMTVTNAETGEVYYVDDTKYLPKAVYDDEYGWIDGYFLWDGTNDATGEYVPSGTVAHVQYDAVLPYRSTEKENVWSFDVTVDYTAPVIESVVYSEADKTLTVRATDEQYLQAIYLADEEKVIDYTCFSEDTKGKTCQAVFDVSKLNTESVYVVAIDYATNEMEQESYLIEGAGEPAVLRFIMPTCEDTIDVRIADSFTFGINESAYGDFVFECWVTAPVEKSVDGSDIEEFYYPGDQIIVNGDMTFYALYAKGDYVPLDVPEYYLPNRFSDDFSGEWALVGYNYDYDSDAYIFNEPIAFGSDGGCVDVVNDLGATVDEEYSVFTTDNTSICYDFEKQTDGTYTVQNHDTGKYLALADGAVVFLDEADETARWTVKTEDKEYEDDDGNPVTVTYTYIFSAANPNMTLLYDDEEGCFSIFDNTVPLFTFFGITFYPTDYYMIDLYARETEAFDVEYFTTKVELHVHSYTAVVTPPTCTEDGYTTYTCDGCGDSYVGNEVAELGHSYMTGVTAPTCTEKGYTTYTCTGCGDTYKANYVDPTGHSFGDWKVTKPATQTEAGTEVRTCSVCGATESRAVPATGAGKCYFKGFTDCKASWYHEAVDFVVSKGLMNGVSATEFNPNGEMTRAMMVTVLYRMAGSPAVTSTASFKDVPAGQWYTNAVAWAKENRVVLGVTEDTFAPMQNVTREQIATILWRYANKPTGKADCSKFEDAGKISAYAKDAMAWAVSEGIFHGDNGNLRPADNALRSEVACIIMRYLGGSYLCK